jgi:hypothetical protein
MKSDPEKLWQSYAKAYMEADTGQGADLEIKSSDGRKVTIGGLYLDFHAIFSKYGVLSTSGPRLLDSWHALNRYMGFYAGLHPTGMVRLSQLATEAIRLAKDAPTIKRGRKT